MAVLPLAAMKHQDVMVATHGHCFDGMASAAIFTHLLRSLDPAETRPFRYKSCGYGPGMQQIPEGWLDGADNAILDFRYTPSKKLTWYFDHHVTGFGTPEERDQALKGPRVFYDPAGSSCAKLIAEVARDRFGVDTSKLAELIGWADLIDAARFPSAEAATARDEPMLQLASVVEHHGDGPFLNGVVPRLLERPVGEVARSEDIQRLWQPLAAAREAFVKRVQDRAKVQGRVVLVDLSDAPLQGL
jgi:hypothetical protein